MLATHLIFYSLRVEIYRLEIHNSHDFLFMLSLGLFHSICMVDDPFNIEDQNASSPLAKLPDNP